MIFVARKKIMLRRGIAVLGPTCSSLKPLKITATRPRRVIELDNDFRYVTTAAPSGSYLFVSITLGLVIIEKNEAIFANGVTQTKRVLFYKTSRLCLRHYKFCIISPN